MSGMSREQSAMTVIGRWEKRALQRQGNMCPTNNRSLSMSLPVTDKLEVAEEHGCRWMCGHLESVLWKWQR